MTRIKEQMRQHLAQIHDLRNTERANPELARRLGALRIWQGERFVATYDDFARQARFSAAVAFFLEDLYGGSDFSARDRDFERVVPVMIRLLPGRVLRAVAEVIALHALSERMDHAMAEQISLPISVAAYADAWYRADDRDSRLRQIRMIANVGHSLDRIVKRGLIRHLLKLMHGPAHAAGLGALQGFLERGFAAFHAMDGAEPFIDAVQTRESQILERLFAGQDDPFAPWVMR